MKMAEEKMASISGKTKATIVVDNETWKEFKKLAIDKEMRISELLQELVKSYLKKGGKK
jgi:predicted DNA-binding ribbon-helix-helix protein